MAITREELYRDILLELLRLAPHHKGKTPSLGSLGIAAEQLTNRMFPLPGEPECAVEYPTGEE